MSDSPRDIIDWFGGWLEGDYDAGTDLAVSTGLEHEEDHPERYRRDGDHYIIIEEDA